MFIKFFIKLNQSIEQVFQLGSDRKTDVITALQYSGLGVTEESTWEDIINALKIKFPSTIYLYKNGDVCSTFTGGYNPAGSYTTYSTDESGKLFLSSYVNSTSDHGFLHTVKPIQIEKGHTKLTAHVTSASQLWSFAWLYVGKSATSKDKYVTIIQYDSNGSSSISNKNIVIDVSNLVGNYYVGVAIQANTANNEGAQVYIDKIWIE